MKTTSQCTKEFNFFFPTTTTTTTTNKEGFIFMISPTIVLHIDQNNFDFAALYFTNEQNNRINIPTEIEVYLNEDEYSKKTIQPSIKQLMYPLCWRDNYVVEWNNKMIVNIKNQRKWTITAIDINDIVE
jgi:hypothetical protein